MGVGAIDLGFRVSIGKNSVRGRIFEDQVTRMLSWVGTNLCHRLCLGRGLNSLSLDKSLTSGREGERSRSSVVLAGSGGALL